jgi:hypothetical protein
MPRKGDAMLEPAKQTSLDLLYRPTAKGVQAWMAQAVAEFPQFRFRILETLRTRDRQAWLYGQGRDAAECRAVGISAAYADPTEKVVTWRMDSLHRYRLAVDFALVRKNKPGPTDDQIEWASGAYLTVLERVPPEHYGLQSLARIGDYGHLEDLHALTLIRQRKVVLR